MNEVLKKIEEIGIVPVVVLNDAKDAEPLLHSAQMPLKNPSAS